MAQHALSGSPSIDAAEMTHLAHRAGVPTRQREAGSSMVEPEPALLIAALRLVTETRAKNKRKPERDKAG